MKEKLILLKRRDETLAKEFIEEFLDEFGISNIEIFNTPVGTRIAITCLRARALINDKKIQDNLAKELKRKFNYNNIVFEVKQVKNPYLDPKIVAFIADELFKKFGVARFKVIGYNLVKRVMQAGARGVEILFSGPIPGALHRTWAFRAGYLPKSGQPAKDMVKKAVRQVKLPRATIGVQVFILPGDTKMPDDVDIKTIEEQES